MNSTAIVAKMCFILQQPFLCLPHWFTGISTMLVLKTPALQLVSPLSRHT